MKRIGLLTSGGDCQGLNAALRAAARALFHRYGSTLALTGFLNGYHGLMYGKYRSMREEDFSNLLDKGGTILGTSRQPFKRMRLVENGFDKVEAMKACYAALGLEGLLVLGGNGSIRSAQLLSQEGLNVITLPKTIDNDIYGTDVSFGFQSAVELATGVLARVHTSAESHGRIFIVELMGNRSGFLTLHAGLASGADVILIPEIPYDVGAVCACIRRREAAGKPFTLIAVAEGARPAGAEGGKESYARLLETHHGAGYYLESRLRALLERETRVVVPGHYQRGGAPCAYDRVLTSRLGVHAAQLVSEGRYGRAVALVGGRVTDVPLAEAAGRRKYVPADGELVRCARQLGVCLGEREDA